MASRLFHAIVGLGISLGTTSLACSGRTIVRQQADDVAADEPTPLAEPSPVTTSTTATPTPTPTSVDASVPIEDAAAPDATSPDGDVDATDAAVTDAPIDAVIDAFCDAAWPTTKGTPPQNPPCPY